ncbi:dihydrodipicolinate synthase family protein, partial [Streptococcus anginosus]|nr:dihydrodipicolinate synthase family protein [Streptococcus anginosus]
IDAGVNGLFLLGSSAETAYLTDAQRELVVTRVVDRAAGRLPVLVGAIDTTANRVIEHARRAQALGADAIVAACPFYAINDMTEIAEHFTA